MSTTLCFGGKKFYHRTCNLCTCPKELKWLSISAELSRKFVPLYNNKICMPTNPYWTAYLSIGPVILWQKYRRLCYVLSYSFYVGCLCTGHLRLRVVLVSETGREWRIQSVSHWLLGWLSSHYQGNTTANFLAIILHTHESRECLPKYLSKSVSIRP